MCLGERSRVLRSYAETSLPSIPSFSVLRAAKWNLSHSVWDSMRQFITSARILFLLNPVRSIAVYPESSNPTINNDTVLPTLNRCMVLLHPLHKPMSVILKRVNDFYTVVKTINK